MVKRLQLDNGLTILAEELHHAPVVALQVWIKAGAADEEPRVSGIAHLHEHMLFKGTARRGVGEIARLIEASGGEINAWTSFDETVYHVVLASAELATGIDVLADAVRNAAFDAQELAREIEVVQEEIRRDQDTPSRRVSHALFELMYREHPYGRPILGTDRTVAAMRRDDLLAFFGEHYRPDNCVVVATGDFQTSVLFEQLRMAFGDWPEYTLPKSWLKRNSFGYGSSH